MSETTAIKQCGICVEFKYVLVSVLAGVGATFVGTLVYMRTANYDRDVLESSADFWAYIFIMSGIVVMPIAVCLGYPLSKVFAHKSNIYWFSLSLVLGAVFGLILGLVFSRDSDIAFSLLGLGAAYGGTFGVFMILLRRIPQMGCKREVSYSTQETAETDEAGDVEKPTPTKPTN